MHLNNGERQTHSFDPLGSTVLEPTGTLCGLAALQGQARGPPAAALDSIRPKVGIWLTARCLQGLSSDCQDMGRY